MDEAPVRILETEKFAVERVAFAMRSGKTAYREMVVHPGAVVILPLLDDGEVVLIRNRRFTVGKRLWELPAGTLDPGEEPADCARRELAEETGYRAGSLRPLLAFYSSPGICNERLHCFVAEGLVAGETDLEETEDIEVVPVSRARLDALLRAGEVEDGKSLAALLYWRLINGQ